MIECEARLKRWGNSLGIVVPKEKVIKENLKPDVELKVILIPKKSLKVEDLWGKFRLSKGQKLKFFDIRKELESKWIR